MPDCLHCPICEFTATGILRKKPYTTYCSKHLLKAIKEMKIQIRKHRAIYKKKSAAYILSDELAELSNEIRRRYYQGVNLTAEVAS